MRRAATGKGEWQLDDQVDAAAQGHFGPQPLVHQRRLTALQKMPAHHRHRHIRPGRLKAGPQMVPMPVMERIVLGDQADRAHGGNPFAGSRVKEKHPFHGTNDKGQRAIDRSPPCDDAGAQPRVFSSYRGLSDWHLRERGQRGPRSRITGNLTSTRFSTTLTRLRYARISTPQPCAWRSNSP